MELTNKQAQGLKIAIDRWRAGERYTVISGYAGSGKSTLVKFIVEALQGLGVPEKKIGYACYTGKAAQVLIDKGNKNAVTLHQLLYKAVLMPNGHYKFSPRGAIEYDVVVVDECSMAPNFIIKELAKYKGVYCIFVGDPGQLPPIYKEEDNHLLDRPHIFLDEIMRQAQDSGIIRLSMLVREGKSIENFTSPEAKVIKASHITDEALMNSDINLCATNATRNKLNQYIRKLRGFSGPIPQNGEKVICLHNEWDIVSDKGNALTNGCIGTLDGVFEHTMYYPRWVWKKGPVAILYGNFTTETNDNFGLLDTDKLLYSTGEPTIKGEDKYKLLKKKQKLPLEFDYAYAITTWKAQGSEWEKVNVLEEGFPHSKTEHQKFLYTAITRATKEVIVYLKS